MTLVHKAISIFQRLFAWGYPATRMGDAQRERDRRGKTKGAQPSVRNGQQRGEIEAGEEKAMLTRRGGGHGE